MPAGVALDGELWAGRGRFKEVTGVSNRSVASDARWERLEYRVFDCPSCPGPLEERVKAAAAALGRARAAWERSSPGGKSYPAAMVDYKRAAGAAGAREALRRVVASGGEGLVFREPGSAYVQGRSGKMLKFKAKQDTEIVVEREVPGKGKHKGRVGALVGKEVGTGTEVSVGTGFTDAERRPGTHPPGTVVRVSFFERTASGKLRHPVYDGKREEG